MDIEQENEVKGKFSNKTKRKKHVKGGIAKNFAENYGSPKKWHKELILSSVKGEPVTDQILIELKDEAKKCHDAEVANYNIKNSKTNSDYQWMKTVMSKGTVADKIAAYTVLIQDNPVAGLETIRNLVGMVKVGKKKECTSVIETLSELFLTDLLRPNQKLTSFHQQPLSLLNNLSSGNAATRKKYLTIWYFEDQLKETYTSFVLALNTAAHDTVDNNKEKAIAAMYKLLAGNPEQEKNLLAYLINKLGDPSQKVASKAIYCLNQLLHKHPNMQAVVLKETEKLLFRPNVASRAQYYAVCFLSQFYLSHEDSNVARRLIEVYFSFFKACIKKGDIDSRMMSALLMGVNRAYPYAKLEMQNISEHIDTMYRVVHIASFNVSLHALSLLYQVSDYANSVNDRFYSALYKKLLDPQISNTTHQAMMLNLIYKALSKDKEIGRVKALIKRLLQVTLNTQPAFSCGILYLVSQVISKNRDLHALVLNSSPVIEGDDDEDDEEKYVDIKDEDDKKCVDVKDEGDGTVEIKAEKEDEEDETESKVVSQEMESKTKIETSNQNNPVSGWVHMNSKKCGFKKRLDQYNGNGLNRNPLYAGGEFCAYTELTVLKNHGHPTVALFADQILSGQTVKYSGDPLKDFTLIRFLDRFVFKNPKKGEELLNQGSHPTFGKRKTYTPLGVRSRPVTSANYLNEKVKNIPVEEMFMYTYLQRRKKEKPEKEDDDSDLESVGSEEFEEMLDKMAGMKDVDDELDYLNDIGENLKKKKKSGKSNHEDDENSEDEEVSEDEGGDFDEVEDEDDNLNEIGDVGGDYDDEDFDEMNDEDKELIGDLSDDDNGSDIIFDSDDEDDVITQSKSKKKKGKDDISSLFASAEEFASLLDDEGSSRVAPGSANAVANRDKADLKQLAWEDKRNRWIKGFDQKVGNNKYSKSDKKFNNKRPQTHKFGKSNKKFKKS